MKGAIVVSLLLKIASLALVISIGAVLLNAISIKIKENLQRTTIQIIALDISSLISLTHIATGDMALDYKLDSDKMHSIIVDGKIVNVKSEDGERSFNSSLPFYSGKIETEKGVVFRISKIDNINRIVAQR